MKNLYEQNSILIENMNEAETCKIRDETYPCSQFGDEIGKNLFRLAEEQLAKIKRDREEKLKREARLEG